MKTKSKLNACSYLQFITIQNLALLLIQSRTIAQASTLVLKIYIGGNQKGTSEGRLRQLGGTSEDVFILVLLGVNVIRGAYNESYI
ncbi:hypothetical protein [uncultured Aggregatibacter sp.]|uniref:hypothetical protein n=1 Tax=uncultured Aggregatibacter sp. TaxID=470564 RepID=UPI002803D1A1|nr:hypothetical protein [uncultured Aggregatibacter sp.]